MLPKAGKPTWFLRRASSAKIEEHVIDFIPAYKETQPGSKD
jgi:hypothetical protein